MRSEKAGRTRSLVLTGRGFGRGVIVGEFDDRVRAHTVESALAGLPPAASRWPSWSRRPARRKSVARQRFGLLPASTCTVEPIPETDG